MADNFTGWSIEELLDELVYLGSIDDYIDDASERVVAIKYEILHERLAMKAVKKPNV